MSYPIKLKGTKATAARASSAIATALTVHCLTDEHEAEALAFLATHSVPNIFMTGLIRDNGMESPFNRGVFYACRNAKGQIEGIALIGHAMLIEAHTENALETLIRLAQAYPDGHVIMGEQEKIKRFWQYYSPKGQEPHSLCRELLFEQQWPVEAREEVPDLRLATLSDLLHVMVVQAEMAYAESGVNPLVVDPVGFRMRCARRIEQGRVWVWIENGRLIFKADIMAEMPEAIYLEGVYVNPAERGKGYGLRCMSQLGRILLTRTKSLCLLVNEQNLVAQTFFYKAGYRLRGCYDTIFLQQKSDIEDATTL